jgi:predicted RNase H-like nuclease (RuvC/YqgF family)
MDTPDLDRLTILERAQLLHDATLRRHGELLDRHADDLARLAQIVERQQQLQTDLQALAAGLLQRQDDQTARLERHAARLTLLEDVVLRLDAAHAQQDERLDRLTAIAAQHETRMAALQQTLDAIKDMLERGNGH